MNLWHNTTMGLPSDPLEAGLALAQAFEAAGISYALGGALAYGIWGIPRATLDVDINIFVDDDQLTRVAEVLGSLGISADPSHLARESDLVDLERLVEVQGPALDVAYVRKELAAMMGEDDARVRRWDELTASPS